MSQSSSPWPKTKAKICKRLFGPGPLFIAEYVFLSDFFSLFCKDHHHEPKICCPHGDVSVRFCIHTTALCSSLTYIVVHLSVPRGGLFLFWARRNSKETTKTTHFGSHELPAAKYTFPPASHWGAVQRPVVNRQCDILARLTCKNQTQKSPGVVTRASAQSTNRFACPQHKSHSKKKVPEESKSLPTNFGARALGLIGQSQGDDSEKLQKIQKYQN